MFNIALTPLWTLSVGHGPYQLWQSDVAVCCVCAGISCLGATIQGNTFFQGDPPDLNYSSVVLASARNKRHFK